MRATYAIVAIAATGLLAWALAAQSNEARSVIDASLKAMGAADLKTVVLTGEGFDACVGQGFSAQDHWRRFSNKNYVRSIDFEAKGWRIQRVRGEGETPPRGGCNAGPVFDQPQNQVTTVTPNSPWATQLEYMMLPTGFLRTAASRETSVQSETIKGKKYTVLKFMGDNQAPVNGYISPEGYVERVSTMIDNNVLGDIVFETTFENYKDFGGVKFPTRISQMQGGSEFTQYNFSDVKPNSPVDLGQQAKGKGAAKGGDGKGKAGPPASLEPEDLGGGFWMSRNGYAAIIANFKDYVVVVEGPQNDARAEGIIADAKRLIPNKPIRYVISTHAHFDHTGGLRAFVAAGATIVTHKQNKGYFERIFAFPHTLAPDRLSRMNPQPKTKVELVGDKRVLKDGDHVIELYHLEGSTHESGTLIIYLPKQKILVEADEFNVGAANAPRPADPNPYHVNLLTQVEKLKLDVDRIIPIHLPNDGRKVTLAELRTAAGK
jgi:glyoxylase-like metal-dependent hydrolase (beta-lactamase superfamily II)